MKYAINLSSKERDILNRIQMDKDESVRTRMRAKILLASDDEKNSNKTIIELADELGTTHTTVQTVRTEYCQKGLEGAVYRKERVVSKKTRKINDDVIKKIWELSESEPPAGQKRWSIRLLCKVAAEQGIVDKISTASMLKVMTEKNNQK